jgi:ribosome-binding protein aMBF1 (putative translation factor)
MSGGGPAGASVADDIELSLGDQEYRAEHERLAPFETLARIVIRRRGALGLSQAELAARMGTTASVISRVESGQHATSMRTLKRLAEALGARAVLGLEFGPTNAREQKLVVF